MNWDNHDWAVVFATLLGPILAVQAQKWVEAAKERRARQSQLFATLMGTRGARLGVEHVRALNAIDTIFYGRKVLWLHYRTRAEQKVLSSWISYLDELTTPYTPETAAVWNVSVLNRFIDLLEAMSEATGHSFDRVYLKKSVYSPQAHGDVEADLTNIRKSVIKVLAGESPVKMAVTAFPINETASADQAMVFHKLVEALANGRLSVEVKADETARG
jgi:hypothetical protein